MELKIYNKEGVLRLTTAPADDSTGSHELMSDRKLSLSFTTTECVMLQVDDYVDYDGVRYRLMEDYTPEMKSTLEWTYSCQFNGVEGLCSRALVLKLVSGEYEPEFSLTAPAADHLQLIIDNINRVLGTSYIVGECIVSGALTIDYTGTFCRDALTKLADLAKSEWWFEGNHINLSRCEKGDYIALGYDNGLASLTKSTANNTQFFTRLFPIGSDRNIDSSVYGSSRLHLPGGAKYVEQNTVFGIIERYEKEAFSAIYPRRIGTVSVVRSETRTGTDGEYTVFFFTDPDLSFNPNDYAMNGRAKNIVFQSGNLNGRDFEVNYNASAHEFEIITQYPYEGMQLPNASLSPKAGDEYVLYNIKMPTEYYALAEAELKTAVDNFLQEYKYDKTVYKCKTDYVDLQSRNVSLSVGQHVRLENPNLSESGYRNSRITKITWQIDQPHQAEIEVSDMLGKGSVDVIKSDIDGVKQYAQASFQTIPKLVRSWEGTSDEYSAYTGKKTEKEFLHKDREDGAKERIRFEKGLSAGWFVEGASGARIDENGDSEMGSLKLRDFLSTPELRYNRITATGNEFWVTDAGVIETVVDNGDGTYAVTLAAKEGEVTVNFQQGDILRTIYRKSTGEFSRACFRVTAVTGDRSFTCTPLSSIAPQKYMTAARQGNAENTGRQGSLYLDGLNKFLRVLDGITGETIDVNNIKVQIGDLSGINHPKFGQLVGFGALLQNVYMDGYIVAQTLTVKRPNGTSFDINDYITANDSAIVDAARIASEAQTTANAAASNATSALSKLTDIASDNKLTPAEKQSTKKEWDAIVAEKPGIDSQADAFAVSRTDYDAGYSALSTYLTPLLTDLTTTTTITGDTFRAKFTGYYTARTALLNAVAAKAKQLADDAKTSADAAAAAVAAEEQARVAAIAQVNSSISGIQDQIDGVVENWYYAYEPTTSNYPASEWTTDADKLAHVGDTFTSLSQYPAADAGKAWRWTPTDAQHSGYHWHPISDSDAVKALQNAAKAQATADGKSSTFLVQPTAYHKGDTWILSAATTVNGIGYKAGEILTANADSTTYKAADWGKKVNYTDDSVANSKAQVFYSQPQIGDSYKPGDIWLNATYSDSLVVYDDDILRCKTAKAAGTAFSISHWVKATKYDNTAVTFEGGCVTMGSLQLAGDDGTVKAGAIGSGDDTAVRFWAGAATANRGTAPYRVLQNGKLFSTDAEITGKIVAKSGKIGAATITGNGLIVEDSDNVIDIFGATTPPSVGYRVPIYIQKKSYTGNYIVYEINDIAAQIEGDISICGRLHQNTYNRKDRTYKGYQSIIGQIYIGRIIRTGSGKDISSNCPDGITVTAVSSGYSYVVRFPESSCPPFVICSISETTGAWSWNKQICKTRIIDNSSFEVGIFDCGNGNFISINSSTWQGVTFLIHTNFANA